MTAGATTRHGDPRPTRRCPSPSCPGLGRRGRRRAPGPPRSGPCRPGASTSSFPEDDHGGPTGPLGPPVPVTRRETPTSADPFRQGTPGEGVTTTTTVTGASTSSGHPRGGRRTRGPRITETVSLRESTADVPGEPVLPERSLGLTRSPATGPGALGSRRVGGRRPRIGA